MEAFYGIGHLLLVFSPRGIIVAASPLPSASVCVGMYNSIVLSLSQQLQTTLPFCGCFIVSATVDSRTAVRYVCLSN